MTGQTGGKSEAERQRRLRLARALRENLKRRKEQVRGRKSGAAKPAAGRTAGDGGETSGNP